MSDPGSGIRIKHLSFAIGSFALRGIDLAVPQGEYFVLTGPNGSGKTVLLKLLGGIYRPTAGRVHIAQNDVTDVPPWERRIGYVPQDGTLFPHLNVRGNVEFSLDVRHVGKDERRERAQRAMKLVAVSHLANRHVAGLSGGERQKVSLARALVFEPAVLLLDEPLSAIDEDGRDALCRELKNVQRRLGITTIHVSHNPAETALVADSVGAIVDGRIETAK